MECMGYVPTNVNVNSLRPGSCNLRRVARNIRKGVLFDFVVSRHNVLSQLQASSKPSMAVLRLARSTTLYVIDRSCTVADFIVITYY
jgi:hypothetical protein